MKSSRTLLTSLGAAAVAAGIALTWADAPAPPPPAITLPADVPDGPGGGILTTDDPIFGDQLAPVADTPVADTPIADTPAPTTPPAPPVVPAPITQRPPAPAPKALRAKDGTPPARRAQRRLAVAPARKAWSFRAGRRWRLFGDTPTAAWSPNGKRLAVNSAYNYLGSRDRGRVETLDLDSGARTVVHAGPGYHPLWLDDQRVAFGCSVYECSDELAGMWLAQGEGRAPKRLAPGPSVYHTMYAGPGRILFWGGFPGYAGWQVYDERSGEVHPSRGLGDDSWTPPRNSEQVDQCPQEAAGLKVRSDMQGLEVSWHGGRWSRIGARPGFQVSWGRGGTVQPCVSPDGSRIAHIASAQGAPEVVIYDLQGDRPITRAQATPGDSAKRPPPYTVRHRWRLFGDTPTAAWSPKGDRLAVGYPERHGTWVETFDVARGRQSQAKQTRHGLKGYKGYQCRTKAKGVRIKADDRGLHLRRRGAKSWETVSGVAPLWMGQGLPPAKPCLTRDGRRIAHFVYGADGPSVAIFELEAAGRLEPG